MDYNFLLEQIKKHGYSVTSLSKEIGMSQVGLKQSIDRKSLKVDMLEKIAKKLGIPIYKFFKTDSNRINTDTLTEVHEWGFYLDPLIYYIDFLQENFEKIAKPLLNMWEEGFSEEERKSLINEYRETHKRKLNYTKETVIVNEAIIDSLISIEPFRTKYMYESLIVEKNYAMEVQNDEITSFIIKNRMVSESDFIERALTAFAETFFRYNDSLKALLLKAVLEIKK
jgi:transcriptional regulator with XRE-family HTH domain